MTISTMSANRSNMSLRVGSVPEIQKGGPCVSHGVQALPNLGLAQIPELEHGKVFVVAIVGGAKMASNVVTLIAQIFEATSLPRFNTQSALLLSTTRQFLDATKSKFQQQIPAALNGDLLDLGSHVLSFALSWSMFLKFGQDSTTYDVTLSKPSADGGADAGGVGALPGCVSGGSGKEWDLDSSSKKRSADHEQLGSSSCLRLSRRAVLDD